jgi:predicted nuclease of restriction endonuclease-like (RecB) superfamily
MSSSTSGTTATEQVDRLFEEISNLLVAARHSVRRTVNDAMVQAYWQIGRLIVQEEQSGAARAAYGKGTLELLSRRLTAQFGKGYSLANLRNFRQFFQTYCADEIRYTAGSELSWSHYRLLMRIEKIEARRWYAQEAIAQNWSVAALERQVSTLYFERLLSSQDQKSVRTEASRLIARDAPADPRDFIRDPYVLEFLGSSTNATLYEKDLEQGLLNQLQHFLLELGKGFAFVARQKHLRIESEDCFVDLVFYNFLLRCFVLVELKVGKLSHQDVGQMDMYVRVCDQKLRQPRDNPTLGLILCSERNDAVARYSLLADSPQLFASRYRALLPTEEELQTELLRDRALIEARNASDGDD